MADEAGARFRRARLAAGVPVAVIARRAGCARQTVYRFEAGGPTMLETASRITETLRTLIDQERRGLDAAALAIA